MAKLHVQRDLEQAVLTVPLRQRKNARRKAFSQAENEVAGLGRARLRARDQARRLAAWHGRTRVRRVEPVTGLLTHTEYEGVQGRVSP